MTKIILRSRPLPAGSLHARCLPVPLPRLADGAPVVIGLPYAAQVTQELAAHIAASPLPLLSVLAGSN